MRYIFWAWASLFGALVGAGAGIAAPADDDEGQVDIAVIRRGGRPPKNLMVRVRVTAITPEKPLDIAWRYSGEGLGGKVVHGAVAQGLVVGEWSQPQPMASWMKGAGPAKWFLTFTVAPGGKIAKKDKSAADTPTNVKMEWEFSISGEPIKTVQASSPSGGTFGLVIPLYRLIDSPPTDPRFLAELTPLLDYARERADLLEQLPWSKGPLPKRFAIVTDLGGYGEDKGYGIRYTDPAIVEAETRALRQLGVNGLRAAPSFLVEQAQEGTGYAAAFNRARLLHAAGYPTPSVNKTTKAAVAEAGCPYGSGVAQRIEEEIADCRELFQSRTPEVWALTNDEIGSIFDRAPEGKRHVAVCDRCAAAYRDFLQAQGLAPADFGQSEWSAVRPVDLWSKDSPESKPDLTKAPVALNAYYTGRFNIFASASMFTALRQSFAQENARKRAALAAGKLDSAAARQPWMYSYALRGNTFLMGGHSLDFFEFYRHADNAFVYETSNRDPRIWGWDSYLCDVGRSIAAEQHLEQGIYIKPHRGAPIQRALSAISRGCRMIYWYTYGPDYFKGDSFSARPDGLALASEAAHLIGRSEDVLYNSTWARPAEVAIVKPLSLEIWLRTAGGPAMTAAWENAKWTYTALAHAHVPVDALDETMLAERDLSQYKVIHIPSPNLTRAAAKKIADWVRAGGTLHTSGCGLARDEANQPLDALQPVLGLTQRSAPEMWLKTALYGATSLHPYPDARAELAPTPPGAAVVGSAPFATGSIRLTTGREILQPAAGTEVLARYADGGAAVTRHQVGRGQAVVVGFFPGLEYSMPVRNGAYDMTRDFSPATRGYVVAPTLAIVRPVVDPAAAVVEGVLLRNNDTGSLAVTLMNWGYRIEARPSGEADDKAAGDTPANEKPDDAKADEDKPEEGTPAHGRPTIAPQRQLSITLRHTGPLREIRSAWLDQSLPFETKADVVTVTLPELREGDVLLLK